MLDEEEGRRKKEEESSSVMMVVHRTLTSFLMPKTEEQKARQKHM